MELVIYGVDIIDVTFRGLHAFMVTAWLLLDFIVFWLHFGVKDDTRPIELRLERARIMHRVDQVVAYLFLLTLPVGIILCFVTDTAIFSTTWLNWKHALYGIIIIDALYLLPISGTAVRNLTAIEQGAENVAELNHQIKTNMNKGMPAVLLIWFLVAFIIVLSMLNLKTPENQQYIFRKTAAETQITNPLPDR